MKIAFWKMNGAGNDFICIDQRIQKTRLTPKQIKSLCHRQRGIGADGILLLEEKKQGAVPLQMRIFNADGGEVDMCGNGARCFARFVQREAKWKKSKLSFQTKAGIVEALFAGEEVRLMLPAPGAPALNKKLQVDGQTFQIHAIDTGVPHIVVWVDDVEKTDVAGLGRSMRQHASFASKGTNVNFVQRAHSNMLKVRTYERGVEAETLACGTGVAASVLVAHLLHELRQPVRVQTRGGDILTVGFDWDGKKFENLTLQGTATFVFKGEVEI